jgi:hypothetical protein
MLSHFTARAPGLRRIRHVGYNDICMLPDMDTDSLIKPVLSEIAFNERR